jgi:hypothetical protein
VNRCLNRLGRALGSFHSLQISSETLFGSLQHIASNTLIDGLKIEGNAVGENRPACLEVTLRRTAWF